MRPSSRQRVAAWLLALSLGRGGEECARRGRLEMISFWLLCWKLLRATAGLGRTAELTDGNHDNSGSSNNNPVNDSPTAIQPTDPVTMEISSSPPLTHIERENVVSWRSQEVEDLHYPEGHGVQQPIRGEQEEEGATEKQNEKRDEDELDYLVFVIGEKQEEDIGSENDGGRDTERREEEREDGGRGDTERGEKEGGDGGKRDTKRGEDQGIDGERGDTEREEEEGENGERGDTEKGEDRGIDGRRGDTEREEKQGEDGERGDTEREEEEGEYGGRREIEGKEEGSRETEREDGRRVDTKEEKKRIEETVGEMEENAVSALLVVQSDPSEQAWSQHLGDTDDLSDCLLAELAVVYSDSDAGEDQWAGSPPCDVSNQEEAGYDGAREEEEREKEGEVSEVKTGREEQREEEVEKEEEKWGGRDDQDEEQSSIASSTDPNRKVPVDFCVPQESYSENVSTEHVDFLLARQQWRKMEEEVKGQPIPKPGLRAQGSFQGTHTSLYPPTRSPRLKRREIHPPVQREPPLSFTMSPSSEDSGLDDLSYRSPLDEPESAVEREIRLTLEREEHHRRERGVITQGLTATRGSTLQTGQSPPRPPACRTPTLSISPSPSCSTSLSRSVYHEMTANNVIILEPDSSASRNRLLSSAIGGLSDWSTIQDAVPSANVIVVETSNLIIRSASEFCLSSTPVSMETQESTFLSNPFFKLRSLSSQSLVEQEIRMVRQREEEWRRQREEMWRRGRERYDTVLVSPALSDNITYNVPEVSDRCVSSPSSPSRTRKMERSSMSCDHKWYS
ncbi:zinc finger CCCH domain-containing protein 13-like isoform X2 [Etheostoma cragini]|uniref:zinc finger CCCH domain-containing protein 13-like isoform X2 n=1 Tax=Etheostoma cragini TaxID=417921 RepID=UPI00155E0F43|nr:zinc finger CCCH domain-containing protein 13-like isoform X2 [Etheostoma cragini]